VMEEGEGFAQDVFRAFKPPVHLDVSAWADTYRHLSSESSAEVGLWSTERAPYQRAMMNAVQEEGVTSVTMMTSAQIGKTEVLLNILGYHIHLDPSPMLFLQPTLDMAEAVSKTRIAPMVRDCPELCVRIADPKARDSGNTLLTKNFSGGHLTLVGANSPASLASRPIRVVVADEVDRYPESAGTEGDPLTLAIKRTATFRNRRVVIVSTPTIEGQSRIETAWNNSDKREYYVPCPECGHFQTLKWECLVYQEQEPENARRLVEYKCEQCGCLIDEAYKIRMISAGRWIAGAPFKGRVGFHINELYSPWRSWRETVEDYLAARERPEMLRAWWNTALGLPYREAGEVPEWERLYERREPYPLGKVPAGGLVLTAGVDVQADRIEIQVVAWGRRHECWSVDYLVLSGSPDEQDVWQKLRAYIARPFMHISGVPLTLAGIAVDSGFKTSRVYAFVRTCNAKQVMAIKGVVNLDQPLASPKAIDVVVSSGKRKVRRTLSAWRVGVSHLKAELYGRLRLLRPTEKGQLYPQGYCHFPEYDAEFFRQLTAEVLITETNRKTGTANRYWKLMRERNEALDTWVYARAAASHLGIERFEEAKWKQMENDLQIGVAPKPNRRPRIKWVEEGAGHDVVA
jgi:phage terminase large subunit GpA-like protein